MGKTTYYPSVTTVSMSGPNDWLGQIREVESLGIKEIALFPTGLKEKERYELYEIILKETTVKRIPFVHLRTDMRPEELDYLVENFQTEVFNLHTTANWPLIYDYSRYADRIFIENGGETIPTEEELSRFAGLCLDFSHWENRVLLGDDQYHQEMLKRVRKFPIGVCHISPIKDALIPNPFKPEELQYDSHRLEKMGELDYLKKYAQFIPAIAAIELENPISEQLEAKQYLQNILK